ncbi:MAG: hypothetical protein U5K69_21125 [Balneolaceae bacterium]|nr:hypothetical protein [Balneolaceae bacterium]
MAQAQTILALGAIVLFMITALNVNRNYVRGVKQNLDQQKYINAINYGQTIAGGIYSQVNNYDNIEDVYGDYDDVTDPARRLQTVTSLNDTLFATVALSGEEVLVHGTNGKKATITVYELVGADYRQRAQYVTAITPIN